jgi:transposase
VSAWGEMDTSTVAQPIDTLGRRVASRRFRTLEEKARIVAESRVPGTSVAQVARRHEVNANQVFAWRRLADQGLLRSHAGEGEIKLLPIKVAGTRRKRFGDARARPSVVPASAEGRIEITLPDGVRIAICGAVSGERIAQVLAVLRR